MNEINIYCDESSHLSYDNKDYMILGAVYCKKEVRKRVCNDIKRIKQKYNLDVNSEMKWTKICNSKTLPAYMDLIEYFFNEPNLKFRGLIAEKNNLDNDKYNDGSYNTWYYKMYYLLLNHLLTPPSAYNIYIDIKDTKGSKNVRILKEVLCNNIYDFKSEIIKNVQQIRSDEVEIMQITDILIGALNYINNGDFEKKHNLGKKQITNRIIELSGCNLRSSTPYSYNDFNIFMWKPRINEK